MDRPSTRAIVLALLTCASMAWAVACGGNVVVDPATSASTSASSSGSGGAGSAGSGHGGDAACALTTTGTTGSGIEVRTECFPPPSATCPTVYDASQYITLDVCADLVSVDCGPVTQNGSCCYVAHEQFQPCGE